MSASNILAVFETASPAQVESGTAWYQVAHEIAREIAPTVEMGAGVLAALSPLLSWDRNVALGRQAFEHGEASGCLGRSCRGANAIMGGAAPLDILGGLKVRSFYANILDPSDPVPVTIDRHAYDIVTGGRSDNAKRPTMGKRLYADLSDAYREVAVEVDMIPAQVQAVTWERWREMWAWRKTAAA